METDHESFQNQFEMAGCSEEEQKIDEGAGVKEKGPDIGDS